MFRCISVYLSLPFWLAREASLRKERTGHALPLQAIEDAEHARVSDAAKARIRTLKDHEEGANSARGEVLAKDGMAIGIERSTVVQGRRERLHM